MKFCRNSCGKLRPYRMHIFVDEESIKEYIFSNYNMLHTLRKKFIVRTKFVQLVDSTII